MAVMENTSAAFGILTDEISSLVVSCLESTSIQDFPRFSHVSAAGTPLRPLISTCIYDAARGWRLAKIVPLPPRSWVLGALYDSAVLEDTTRTLDVQHRRWFADFNFYTMQRVPELWDRFAEWRRDV